MTQREGGGDGGEDSDVPEAALDELLGRCQELKKVAERHGAGAEGAARRAGVPGAVVLRARRRVQELMRSAASGSDEVLMTYAGAAEQALRVVLREDGIESGTLLRTQDGKDLARSVGKPTCSYIARSGSNGTV